MPPGDALAGKTLVHGDYADDTVVGVDADDTAVVGDDAEDIVVGDDAAVLPSE